MFLLPLGILFLFCAFSIPVPILAPHPHPQWSCRSEHQITFFWLKTLWGLLLHLAWPRTLCAVSVALASLWAPFCSLFRAPPLRSFCGSLVKTVLPHSEINHIMFLLPTSWIPTLNNFNTVYSPNLQVSAKTRMSFLWSLCPSLNQLPTRNPRGASPFLTLSTHVELCMLSFSACWTPGLCLWFTLTAPVA